MPRGRKRSRRRQNPDLAPPHATPGVESSRSKAYEAGRTVKYAYRINGPQFPVSITSDLNADPFTRKPSPPTRRRAFG